MIASNTLEQSRFMNSNRSKESSSMINHHQDIDDKPVFNTNINLQMIDQNEQGSSNKSKKDQYEAKLDLKNDIIDSENEYSDKNDSNMPHYESSKDLDEEQKFTKRQSSNNTSNENILSDQDILHEKLIKFHEKAMKVNEHINEFMQAPRMVSLDQKINIIRK